MDVYRGSLYKVQQLTTNGYVASFPTSARIRCVAPEFSIKVVRVSTVVAGVCNAVVRIHVVLTELMLVWILRRPGLTLFAGLCYRRVAHVQTSIWCQVAVLCTMLFNASDVDLAMSCTWVTATHETATTDEMMANYPFLERNPQTSPSIRACGPPSKNQTLDRPHSPP